MYIQDDFVIHIGKAPPSLQSTELAMPSVSSNPASLSESQLEPAEVRTHNYVCSSYTTFCV